MSEPSRWVHEVSTVSLENKTNQLTNIVYSLIAGGNEPSRGETSEIVFTDGTFPGPPQITYNPYDNTYNPGWKDHPNFSYVQNQRPNQVSQQGPFQQHYQQPQKTSLELMMEKMAISQEKIMEKLDASQEYPNHVSKKLKSRTFYGHEKVNRWDNIFAVFTRRLTSMLKNQGMFAKPQKINRISLKEVLSWTNRKRQRKLQCL
ncbi:hypothetical protein GQ457_05G028810 [Hibiscus cannabinus]